MPLKGSRRQETDHARGAEKNLGFGDAAVAGVPLLCFSTSQRRGKCEKLERAAYPMMTSLSHERLPLQIRSKSNGFRCAGQCDSRSRNAHPYQNCKPFGDKMMARTRRSRSPCRRHMRIAFPNPHRTGARERNRHIFCHALDDLQLPICSFQKVTREPPGRPSQTKC